MVRFWLWALCVIPVLLITVCIYWAFEEQFNKHPAALIILAAFMIIGIPAVARHLLPSS